MQNRLSRRGYNLEECRDLLEKRKGNLLYLKKRTFRQSNIKDINRFC